MKTKWIQSILLLFGLVSSNAFGALSGTNVDLGLSTKPDTNTLALDNTVTFRWVLTNSGPNNVTTSITVNTSFTAGLTYSGSSGSGFYDSTSGAWTLAGLPAFTTATQSVTMRAVAVGTQTNTLAVVIPPGYTDSVTTNNSASSTVVVTGAPVADLAVGLTVATNTAMSNNVTVPLGGQVQFFVGLTNLGPSSVGPVTVTTVIPSGFRITTNTSGNYGGDTYDTNTGNWTLPQAVASNAYFLIITAIATNISTYSVTSSVAVPSGVTDPVLTNNTSYASVTVRPPQADFAIGKTVNTNSTAVGQQVVFTLALTNLGPDTIASNLGPIRVTDLLPSGFQYLSDNSSSIPNSSYNAPGGIWTLAGLGSPPSIVFLQITATASVAGSYTNTALVNVPTNVIDPNTNNNFASAVVTVTGTNQTTNTGSFILSGYVRGCATNGIGFAYVTITLTGATNLAASTDTNGFYSFTNLSAGTYNVTPSQAGNTFVPGNAIVTLNSNAVAQTFVAGKAVIQGSVTYGTNGPGIPGIPVETIGQAERTVVTDANGRFIFTNCAPGVYTLIVPNTNGFSFSPSASAALVIDATNCNAQYSFFSKSRTAQLVALEVVQVIQDWSNSVPLVSAKKTYVRAHLQSPYTTNQFGFVVTPPPLLLTGARLYNNAAPNAPQAPLNTNGALLIETTNAATVRGDWDSTLNFELPPAWTAGTISLRFVCTNNVTVVPTNTVPANSTVSVTFTASPILPVKYFAWNWTNGANLQTISADAYADLPGRLLSMYPVPDATRAAAILNPAATLNIPLPIPPAIAATEKLEDWVLLNSNSKLSLYQAFDVLLGGRFGGGGSNWIYFGAIAGPSSGTTGWAKAVISSSNTVNNAGAIYVSSGFVISNFYATYRHTPQHEIGHNLGRPHDVMNTAAGVCNEGATNGTPVYPLFQKVPPPGGPIKPAIGPMTNGTNALIYGLDTLTLQSTNINPVVSPTSYFDVMSYCKSAPLDRWISTYTYTALRSNIVSGFTPPPAPPAAGPSRTWLYVRGYIDSLSGAAGFLPFWKTSSTATNPPPGSPVGTFEIRVYDSHGNLIETMPFSPDPYVVEEGNIPAYDEGEFLVPLPVLPDMHAIEVINTLNSQSIATITGSTSIPSVSSVFLTDLNGQPFSGVGPLVVHWSSSDADPSAQLLYAVQYSTDGGNTWETLDMDISGTSYQITSLYLPASFNALIRVLASDGFNTSASASSPSFVMPNHPPSVRVNTPGNNSVFAVDQQIVFDASAIDPQDGPLDGVNVQWISSVDGFLGNGAMLTRLASDLSEGIHLITVTAVDNEALTASASVQIFVLHQPQPELSIQVAGNQTMLSWPSSVTNYALFSTRDLATGLWTPVANPPVAADATQTVTVGLASQSQFFVLKLK